MESTVTSFLANTGIVTVLIRLVIIFFCTLIVCEIAIKLIRHFAVRDGSPLPSSSIFVTIAKFTIWAIGVALALQYCLGIDATALIAALGVGGIAISLGFQQTLSNLIGGLQISHGKLIAPGDHITVLAVTGRVEDVTWRHTVIRDYDDNLHFIPNSLINTNALTCLEQTSFIDIPFVIPPDTDLAAFIDEATARIERDCPEVLAPGKHPAVRFDASQAEGMAGRIRIEIENGSVMPTVCRTKVALACGDLISTRNPHITY